MSVLSLQSAKEKMTGLEAESTTNNFTKDERMWTILGKTGSARVRFLPWFDGHNVMPYVCLYQIAAKRLGPDGKTKWLIDKSLKSIGQNCPLDEAVSFLKTESAKGNKAADELLNNGFKLTKRFYSNVLIRTDAANGTSSGKVMIFSYGTQLKNLLESFASPNPEQVALGAKSKDPFDPLNGYDIILTKTLGNNGIPSWESTKVVEEGNGPFIDKITTVPQYLDACREGKIHDITKLKDISEFKTYEQLKTRIATFYPGLERGVLENTSGYIKPVSANENLVSPAQQAGVKMSDETPFEETQNGNWLD